MNPNHLGRTAPSGSRWRRFHARVVGQARDPLSPDALDKV